MRKNLSLLLLILVSTVLAKAQTNIFPATGNVGVGTIAPTSLFQVNGGISQFGGLVDYARFAADGDLTFTGLGDYTVGGDRYAFRYGGNQNFGLFFSAINSRFEFRDGSAAPILWVTGGGNGYIKSKLAIGSTITPKASLDITPTNGAAIKINPFGVVAGNTGEIRFAELVANGNNYVGFKSPDIIAGNKIWVLPSTDGTAGQYLKTDGTGKLGWASDANTNYTAGTGLLLTGTVFSNTAPDQTVTLTGDGVTSISGTYPNFTISTPAVAGPEGPMGPAGADGVGIVSTVDNGDGTFTFNYSDATNFTTSDLTGPAGPSGTANISGTNNYVIKFTGATTGANSMIYDNGTTVGINTTTPAAAYKLDIVGADMQVNSVRVGRGNGNISSNTALGSGALNANTTGVNNSGIGYQALNSNTTGSYNYASGYRPLYTNTTGTYNTAVGNSTLFSNTTGTYNNAIGNRALYYNIDGADNTAVGALVLHLNTSGSYNTGIGNYALYANTTGNNNSALGYYAMYFNTTGSYNTAMGNFALLSNSSGGNNTAIGYTAINNNTLGMNNTGVGFGALYANTSGNSNTAIGVSALYSNSIGIENTSTGVDALFYNTTGNSNTANGFQALYSNTDGDKNTAMGELALYSNTTGYDNVAIGYKSVYNGTTGYHNTGIGIEAMFYNVSGFNNTAIGYYANGGNTSGDYMTAAGYSAASFGSYDNSAGFGYDADMMATNTIHLGNSSITSIKGQVGFTTYSDKRFKQNITEDEVVGLDFITKLRPVTYNTDIDAYAAYVQQNFGEVSDGNWPDKYAIEEIRFSGFIAQEVEAAAREAGYDFSGVDRPKNDKDIYGLRYAEFVVPLVKAVQELDSMNNTKEEKINALEAELANTKNDLQAQINALTALILNITAAQNTNASSITLSEDKASSTITLNGAWLEQNVPNPFTGSTIIRCYIPEGYHTAEIVITAQNGVTLKRAALNQSGINEVTVDASAISSGAYQYTLIVDGELIGTKQMLLTK